jgi:hypothetical protein
VADAGFTMSALWAVRDDRTLTVPKQRFLTMLIAHAGRDGTCEVSTGRLAAELRTSEGAVRRMARDCEADAGPFNFRIERQPPKENGSPRPNRFVLQLRANPSDPPDHPDPPDHGDPTPRSPKSGGPDHADPTPPITVIPEEDLRRGSGKRIVERAPAVLDVLDSETPLPCPADLDSRLKSDGTAARLAATLNANPWDVEACLQDFREYWALEQRAEPRWRRKAMRWVRGKHRAGELAGMGEAPGAAEHRAATGRTRREAEAPKVPRVRPRTASADEVRTPDYQALIPRSFEDVVGSQAPARTASTPEQRGSS